ncbi:chalcone-flavanone isomerase-domain-containing protein [Podospora fimiseda]|uniref:Chalcone-flavanone isomerase-domain-containing protein n=1 Tax=Podospora fimiseda TaxID=252190 RepID=A0AAN7BFV1_9PEZI|nr:chalcone-flavanone isomerase-domain-containing protein [Podospora fimiseda]
MMRQPIIRQVIRPPTATTPRLLRPHVTRRAFRSRGSSAGNGAKSLDTLNIRRISQEAEDYHRNRRIFLWSGAIAGVVSFGYTAYKLVQEFQKKPAKLDSSLPSSDPLSAPGAADRKVVVHDEEGREIVPTGNSTVPTFPRTIDLPSYTSPLSTEPVSPGVTSSVAPPTTEYTLVGLGLRTVTFIGIQVYVVGYYVATSDIAALQSALVKRVNPIATTLVPGERDELRAELLDPEQSGKVWDELLARGIPARSAFRVIPVRDTDFHHLRDGFVRAIQDRTKQHAHDDSFGEAMRQFRAIFNRGSVPKKKELLLVRDETGKLSIAYDGSKGKKTDRQLVGIVEDERVSRALWLNYLGGKVVASEPARKSIVEGVMEFVERPVGTVAAQVVPVVRI